MPTDSEQSTFPWKIVKRIKAIFASRILPHSTDQAARHLAEWEAAIDGAATQAAKLREDPHASAAVCASQFRSANIARIATKK